MAIVGGQDEEDLKNGAAPAAGGGEGGFVEGGSGQGATTKAGGAAPTSSGSYTNLSSYLQANQGSGATTGRAAENVVDQSGRVASAAQGAYKKGATGDIDKATTDMGAGYIVHLNEYRAGGAKADPTKLASIEAGRGKVNVNEGA